MSELLTDDQRAALATVHCRLVEALSDPSGLRGLTSDATPKGLRTAREGRDALVEVAVAIEAACLVPTARPWKDHQ